MAASTSRPEGETGVEHAAPLWMTPESDNNDETFLESWSEGRAESLVSSKSRKVYGGGKTEWGLGGDLTTTGVALFIASSSLGASPVLISLAAYEMGLPAFFGVLILLGALSAISYIVIAVEARYVGAQSWEILARNVFPRRFRMSECFSWISTGICLAYTFIRGSVSVIVVSDLLLAVVMDLLELDLSVDKTRSPKLTPQPPWWCRALAVVSVCVFTCVFPRDWTYVMTEIMRAVRFVRRQLLIMLNRDPGVYEPVNLASPPPSGAQRPPIFRTASIAGSTSLVLWPLTLALFWYKIQDWVSHGILVPQSEDMQLHLLASDTPWPKIPRLTELPLSGLGVFLYGLCAQHDAFLFISSLKRGSSLNDDMAASANTGRNFMGQLSKPGIAHWSRQYLKKRPLQWPLACFGGLFFACLMHGLWASAGLSVLHLAVPGDDGNSGYSPYPRWDSLHSNILLNQSLPRGDLVLLAARFLSALAILVSAEPALYRLYAFVDLLTRKANYEVLEAEDTDDSDDRENTPADSDISFEPPRYTIDDAEDESTPHSLIDMAPVASGQSEAASTAPRAIPHIDPFPLLRCRSISWLLLAGATVTASFLLKGRSTFDLSVLGTEVSGFFFGTTMAFIFPPIFFVILFHVRSPRAIFVANISAQDTLLLRKERQLQSKLTGRRLWQDVFVFGGLFPVGIIITVHGFLSLLT